MNLALFREYKDAVAADETAKAHRLMNRLVQDDLLFVERCARRMANQDDLDDVRQVALIGFMRAIRAYDEGKGRFEAYARPWIFGEIKRHAIALRSTVRVTKPMPASLKRTEEVFVALTGRLPTASELCVDEGDLEEYRTKTRYVEYAEEADVERAPRDEDRVRALLSTASLPSEEVLLGKLRTALTELSEKDFRILIARIIDEKTLEAIGGEEGVRFQTAARMIENVLENLRGGILCRK